MNELHESDGAKSYSMKVEDRLVKKLKIKDIIMETMLCEKYDVNSTLQLPFFVTPPTLIDLVTRQNSSFCRSFKPRNQQLRSCNICSAGLNIGEHKLVYFAYYLNIYIRRTNRFELMLLSIVNCTPQIRLDRPPSVD